MYSYCDCTYFGLFILFHYSPLSLSPRPLFFQQISIHIVISATFTDVMFAILLVLYLFLLLYLFPWVPQSSSTITDLFYKELFIWSCLVLCMCLSFVSIFHIWEKTCGLCVSEPGLLHLTWYSPIASIYLRTTWLHSSLWPGKTPWYIYITFSWSIHQL
jgi:hypothetical protein